jgi:hypothetical protein
MRQACPGKAPTVRVGVVGCVKEKQDRPAPARDLYTSPLFLGRRAFVERTCDRWFIPSAKYGLAIPSTLLEPYDETLADAPVAHRHAWSEQVLDALGGALGDDRGTMFEAHAGAVYLSFGLTDGILRRGGMIVNPTEGLSFGRQLAFYSRAVR